MPKTLTPFSRSFKYSSNWWIRRNEAHEYFFDFAKKIRNQIKFIIEPYTRFKGKPGEQATMFFLDPSGNALEFKAFNDDNQIFAK